MKRRGTRKSNQRGAALILALLLVAIMGIGCTAVWRYLHTTLSETRRYERTETVQHLAEGGLEKAVAELRAAGGRYRGEEHTPLGAGRFSVAVQPEEGKPGTYRLLSVGELEDGGHVFARRVLEADLQLTPDGEVQAFYWRIEKR